MKAVALTGLRKLELIEVPTPQIGSERDVLLKISTVGICGSGGEDVLDVTPGLPRRGPHLRRRAERASIRAAPASDHRHGTYALNRHAEARVQVRDEGNGLPVWPGNRIDSGDSSASGSLGDGSTGVQVGDSRDF